MGLYATIHEDMKQKSLWLYESDHGISILKVLLTDGTNAMILYRLMQSSRRWRLAPLEMIFNKMIGVFGGCVIGRGAEFGPGLVLIHSNGIVINGQVRGGARVHIEHQVTIGANRRQSPILGDDVFIGAGAKIIGAVNIGSGAKIGANAVVLHDVPPGETAVGVPAKLVTRPKPEHTEAST